MSKQKKRVVAAMFLLVFAVALVFSSVFIISHAHHNCTEDHCETCVALHICQNLLQNLAGGLKAAAIFAAPLLLLCALLLGSERLFYGKSLIINKIRLNI
ncbi:MAG: hypothetical protein LBM65_03265 [Oscillospiraceae bacterium]|nr:hypothetical protein [Oscillospiraceae bacterium]